MVSEADPLPATLNPPFICKIPAPAVGAKPPILTSPLDMMRIHSEPATAIFKYSSTPPAPSLCL